MSMIRRQFPIVTGLFVAAGSVTAAVADTITFEDYVWLASFRSDGLYNLNGLGSWNGQPLSETNRPNDAQRQLAATINYYVRSDAPNVLFVQVTEVLTTQGASWFGTAFNNVTQTGVRISFSTFGGAVLGSPDFSSDFANPGQIRAYGGSTESTEPLTTTPGYTMDVEGEGRYLIHTVSGSENGFTSLGGIYGASRIRGGGVFRLTFDPSIDLRQMIDFRKMAVECEYGRGNQYIPGVARRAYGDLNCDGQVAVASDIDGFVVALVDPEAYGVVFPGCDPMLADLNFDGHANADDMPRFIEWVTSP